MQYLVLGGGTSPEKDVSNRSAAAMQSALQSLGHTVTYLNPATTPLQHIIETAKASDGVFPVLHGAGGEDGTLQRVFEREDIPYFGPDSMACERTFDKVIFKKVLEEHAILTPQWSVVSAQNFIDSPLTKAPFVIKPITGGSSIDTFIVRSIPFDATPILEALSRYETMLIEELIEGDEITVGVLENEALPVVEIIPPQDKEFDYENKYNGATRELCPPEHTSVELQQKAQALALTVHAITQCRHLSRTDMLINAQGELFVIDTNTIPGLTDQSLYPKAAAAAGCSWTDLVQRFASFFAQ